MKKLEIKYSNGAKNIVDVYEKEDLNQMSNISNLVSISVENVNLYIEKKNVIFENCSYINSNDVSFYDNLIKDNKVLSSLKLNKLIALIFHFILLMSSLMLLHIPMILIISGMKNNIYFLYSSVALLVLSIITGVFSFLFANKNEKILRKFMKNINIENMTIHDEINNKLNEKLNDKLNKIEKFNYKEDSLKEEVIFKIKEKMEEKLLYK